MAIGAFLESDHLPAGRVGAERYVGRNIFRLAFERKPSCVAAFRVVGAADECAEFAELEAEPAGAATRAEPRIALGTVVWKEMRSELGVECGQHLADRQFLCAVDRGRKVPPEVAEHLP